MRKALDRGWAGARESVDHAQVHQGLILLCNGALERIAGETGGSEVEQLRVVDPDRPGNDGIAATDVELHGRAGVAQQVDAAGLPGGVYLYRLEAGAHAQTRRVTLLK